MNSGDKSDLIIQMNDFKDKNKSTEESHVKLDPHSHVDVIPTFTENKTGLKTVLCKEEKPRYLRKEYHQKV